MASPGSIIAAAVGFGGANRQADVTLVQRLLNAVPADKGGAMPALDADGLCGPLTCGAISRFQSRSFGTSDGRIDPGQRTEQALVALLNALGVLATLLAGGAASAPPPGGAVDPTTGAPVPAPTAGPRSPIRQRFMAVCRTLLPPPGMLTVGQKSGATGTGCGEFPGRVFTHVPVIPPGRPGAFKADVRGQGVCFLTTPMTIWEQFAKAVDEKHGSRTWVPFAGNRPLPGDIYILGKWENPAAFQHVGVIVTAQGNEWMTADGGQGGEGWQSGFIKRQFHASGQIDGEFGNTAMLRGWVDLDALYAVAVASFPQNL